MISTPVEFFCYVAFLAALGGVATVLRTSRTLTNSRIVGSILNSSLVGVVTAMAGYSYVNEDQGTLWLLMSVSILAGIGGTSLVDIIKGFMSKGGFTIRIQNSEKDEK